jgi:hypothetical protein
VHGCLVLFIYRIDCLGGRVFRLFVATVFGPKARGQNHENAQDNENVGKIERRPKPGLPMEIQIIDNIASKDSVDYISNCVANPRHWRRD